MMPFSHAMTTTTTTTKMSPRSVSSSSSSFFVAVKYSSRRAQSPRVPGKKRLRHAPKASTNTTGGGGDDDDKSGEEDATMKNTTIPAEFTDSKEEEATTTTNNSNAGVKSPYEKYRLASPITFERLETEKDRRKYPMNEDGYFDLVAKNDVPSLDKLIRDLSPEPFKRLIPTSNLPGEALFESPLVSFAYERGWRDNFKRSGFPGVEVEKENAMEALGEDAVGDVIIDCSCGSGLFTREFARSGKYDGIVALDFSESMIKEAMERAQKDTSVPADKIAFVRADVGRLPFANDSIGGVSASAAIHCWPDVQSACAEIFRVLKPGRIFTGTTFATPNVPFLDDDQNRLLSTLSRDLSASRPGTNGLRFWNSADLRDQLQSIGFSDVTILREKDYLFWKARKP
jgi:SAM-dependent methyltransferase